MAFSPQRNQRLPSECYSYNGSEYNKPTKIILVKGVPFGMDKSILEAEMVKWGRIKRICSKPSTSHFYIEYQVSSV
jgi:hypothetical protein